MFFAFSRFNKPGDFIGARLRTGTWLKSEGLTAYLARQGSGLERTVLQEADLATLELLMDDAWQEHGFGGFNAEDVKAAAYGFSYFRLDEGQIVAELVA